MSLKSYAPIGRMKLGITVWAEPCPPPRPGVLSQSDTNARDSVKSKNLFAAEFDNFIHKASNVSHQQPSLFPFAVIAPAWFYVF